MVFEEIDRWWGCEIHFGAELDSSFEVKNIKRGAKPEPELLSAIKEQISPTRYSVLEEVRRVWKETREQAEAKKQREAQELDRHLAHVHIEKAAAKGVSPRAKFDANVSVEEATTNIKNKFLSHMEETQQARIIELYKSQPYTIVDDPVGWKGGTFGRLIFRATRY